MDKLVETREKQKLYFDEVVKTNKSKSNLTELNATDAVNNGFMSHNDWVAHVTRYGYIQKMITKLKPKTVFEAGCGRFPLVNYLWRNRDQNKFKYYAADLRARVQWFEHLGWKKGDVYLVRDDLVLSRTLFNDLRFDVTIATEVFEHVPTDKAPLFMKRLFNWTKPGGVCIFSTPNAGVSKSTADNHKDENGESREWAYKDKVNLAKSVGFEVVNTYGTFIAKSRIPEEFWTETTIKAADFLPHAMFTVYAAASYPAESNNSLFLLKRPGK